MTPMRRGRPWAVIAALCAAVLVTFGLAQPASAAPGWPVVGKGAAGPDVRSAQYLLAAHGHGIDADGQFGPATEGAVRAFQQAKGYGVDGILGSETWPGLVITVREGDKGHAVSAAQTALNKHGAGLSVDGQFGPATAKAARAFQDKQGLTADGIVGPQTWQQLVGQGGSGGGYSLPVARGAASRDAYGAPHHDYPALDLPVGTGTPLLAVTSGVAERVSNDRCGYGYQLRGDDGATYLYCHLSQHQAGSGVQVEAGTQLGLSGSTGNSTGPHLHLEVNAGGAQRCPQPLMLAVYDGAAPPAPGGLPTGGCIG
ncbi:peptidoglycan-binding protein [Streptomyces sp. AJS327]|uniref:peptidoglycan-binding protein n=1 Tax=Streptomyces sp. AJS327 TaxID=2545265 RepID=UPI0015DF9EE3|nr:peptidoglycan-binding protein [Streptomyces sp. AJS327]MBA0050054.1 peptidoglycan-binding protein [Streptomyces sp. AJS327]